MIDRTTIPSFQSYGFSGSKIVRFIETLKRIQFSGQLVWTNSSNDKKWSFYFYLGHIFYATGGIHSVRRWTRSLATHCPHLQINMPQLRQDLCEISVEQSALGWEYYLFDLWFKQQYFTQEQAQQIVQTILTEVLFELSQFQDLTHQIQKAQARPEPFVVADERRAFADVQKLWQGLWKYNIDASFLDKAPLIRYPEQLQQWAPTEEFQTLVQLLDGEKTLRDLAIQARQELVQAAYLLLPYVQAGIVELTSVPDLPALVCSESPHPRARQTGSIRPLIACVDDSVAVCWTMEKLLVEAGYQFVGINDGLRAITMLLSCKPDLIFLDVFMPNTNGYEICRNLRKAHSFRQTPIVFLTGLDGVVDQVRARLAGASDFLSKPIDAERVLNTVAQYLKQGVSVP